MAQNVRLHFFSTVKGIRLLHQSHAALYLTTLSLCAALAVPAVHAIAARIDNPAVQIYLYDQNGNPVNVTNVDSYHVPHVYDPDGVLIGIVGTNNAIYNSNNQNIGYITE